MGGGVNAIARLLGKVDSNNALVVAVDAASAGVVTSITGTANKVLANGTSGSAQAGAVTVTLADAVTITTSITAPIVSQDGTVAGTGFLRLQNAGLIAWRANAGGSVGMRVTGGNDALSFAGGTVYPQAYELFTAGATGLSILPSGVVSASGSMDTPLYKAGGTNGVTAGPFTAITSITVKAGLVTAISGT